MHLEHLIRQRKRAWNIGPDALRRPTLYRAAKGMQLEKPPKKITAGLSIGSVTFAAFLMWTCGTVTRLL